MSLESDERAAMEIFAVLRQHLNDIVADVGRANIIQAELNDTGQGGLALKKQFGEVQVLRQHDRTIFTGPTQDVRVRCVRRPEFAPMAGGMSVLPEIFDPGNRKAVVYDNDHAGRRSTSRSRVSHAAYAMQALRSAASKSG